MTFLNQFSSSLCDDCRKRIQTNPLRCFDCKKEECISHLKKAPRIIDHICGECQSDFTSVHTYLNALNIPFTLDGYIVRGLDYYTKTAFEFVSQSIGAKDALGGGGRYDDLTHVLGGPETPAVGYAGGLERLMLLYENSRPVPRGVFFVTLGDEADQKGFVLLSKLQQIGVHCNISYDKKSMKSQLRQADKWNAHYVCIMGEQEIAHNAVIIKNMQNATQETVLCDRVVTYFQERNKNV